MSAPLGIDALLTELGYDTDLARQRARAVLEEARLTNPRKQRIDAGKRERVEELLASRFLVICGSPDCAREAKGREVLTASHPEACQVCGGSANRRALDAARRALSHAGLRRIVIVGGSPVLHSELQRLRPAEWELRLVDGTGRRTLDQARTDLQWADLVLVWGATELDHKVSTLYTQGRDPHVVTVSRRGLAALFDTAAEHARRR